METHDHMDPKPKLHIIEHKVTANQKFDRIVNLCHDA